MTAYDRWKTTPDDYYDNEPCEQEIAEHFGIDFAKQDFGDWDDDLDGIMSACVTEARKTDSQFVDFLIQYTGKVCGEEPGFWEDSTQQAFIEALRPIIVGKGPADPSEVDKAMLESKTGEICWHAAYEKAVA